VHHSSSAHEPLFCIAFTFLCATAFCAEKTQLSFAINDGNGAPLPAACIFTMPMESL
jgi:hypothetical protein